jgi:Domain of unknown function (DUF5667)
MPSTAGKIDSTMRCVKDNSEILAQCLDAIERGESTVEACAAQHPEFANLRDLLNAASAIQSLPLAALPEHNRAVIRQRMLATYRARQVRVKPMTRQPRLSIRFALSLMVAFMLVFGGSTALVRAADSAVPGDGLYGLKRAVEVVQLSLADSHSRPGVLYDEAQNRLTEISVLSLRGQPITQTVLSDMVQTVNAAMRAQSDPAAQTTLRAQATTVLAQATALGVLDSTTKSETLAILATVPPGNSSAGTPATVSPATTASAVDTESPTDETTVTLTDVPEPTKKPGHTPKPRPTSRPPNGGPPPGAPPGNGNGKGLGNGKGRGKN